MTELPQAFLSQMAAQLKGEMAAFLRTYDEPYQRGLRVNPWKRPTLLLEDCGERVPWEVSQSVHMALCCVARSMLPPA